MDRIWLSGYPAGVPAEIDPDLFQSVPDLLEQAASKYSGRPAFHNLGLAWWRLGKANQAMAAYRRAIELDPSNVEPHCGLGHALAALGRPEESLETMRSAVAAIPGSGKAHYNFGVAAERLLMWDEAAAAYRRSIEMNPLRPEAYTRLANLCLFILCRPDEAIESLNAALELDPTDARVKKALDDAIEFVVR